jgi:PAS domain S-box-containing protein
MAAGEKKPEEQDSDITGSERSLRAAAGKHLARSPKDSPDLTGQTPEQLIHELQVHQIELETQAEELRRAHLALTESRDKYLDLYEFAPTGYLTLNDRGLITEVNLTGAVLLGVERSKLINAPFSKFFAENESDPWHRNFMNVLKTGEHLTCNPTFIRGDGSTFPARLEGVRLASSGDGVMMVRIAFSDITDIRNAKEAERRHSANLSILNGIISTTNKADDLPRLLDNILAESLRLLDFDAGGIYLVDQSTRTADVVHSRNLPPEFLVEIQTVPIDKKPYDTLFVKNEPIFTENYAQLAPGRSGKSGFQSMASIPLLSKGVTIGALNIASLKRQVISEDEKQVFNAIGRELGSTIERMAAEEEVKKARKNLETLFNSIDEMVFVLDMQGRILTVNRTVSKRLSYASWELTGTDVLLLHVPERRDEALKNVKGMIAGTIDSCPVPVLAKDGTRIEVETKVTRGSWNNQEVLIGISRDVTERKVAEEGLRKSENLLRSMIESPQSIIIFSLDREYRYLAFNTRHQETMKAIWGVDICPGMNMPDTIRYESDRKKARQNFDRVLAGEHFMMTEEYGDEALGRMIWENTYSPIYDENRQVIGLTVYVIDITGRKKAEEKLRKLSDRLSLATRAGGVGIWEYDIVNNTLSWDEQMFTLYGTTREQFGGAYEAWQAGVHPEDRERGDAEIRMALSGEREFNTEFRVLRPDGSIRNIRALAIVQRDAGGKPVRMIGTNWDITVEKNTEEALRQANKKLNLLSSITRHDINNQLTVQMGYLELLEDTQLDDAQEEYFGKVSTAAHRIAAMIQFTKEYEQIGVHAPIWQDCRTLVDTAAKDAPLGKVRVENDLPAGMDVFADPLIVKVCYNLMDNAVRYGGKITTIRFSAEERDGDVVIVCSDDGNGVSVEEKEKIFERGFGKNTGLGLALSREILSITGITIKETGEPGKGARFEMVVPKRMWRK